MVNMDNQLVNAVVNLAIAESNTALTNTMRKVKIESILDFMPNGTANLLRENASFLKEQGIDISNPKDMIECAVKVIFSQFDILSNQISKVQESLLGDRISEIQSAKKFYNDYIFTSNKNIEFIEQLKELINHSDDEIVEAIKKNQFSTIEKKYKTNQEDERYYLKQVIECTTHGINQLQNSFETDIKTILDMPTTHVGIKSAFPFLCKFTKEKISKVRDIDESNHRCKKAISYIEQGYRLQLLATINLHGNNSEEYIQSIIDNFNSFLKNKVMNGNNLMKIHGYDDKPKEEFWITQPQRMLNDMSGFKKSLSISKTLNKAIEDEEEEFYEYEDYDNIEIL